MYNVIQSCKPQIIYTFNGMSLLDSLHVCPKKKTPILNSREELDLHTHTLSLSLSKCASKTPILNSREALDLHTHTHLGDADNMMILEKRNGRSMDARQPTIPETE
jgi:hypothetical protein